MKFETNMCAKEDILIQWITTRMYSMNCIRKIQLCLSSSCESYLHHWYNGYKYLSKRKELYLWIKIGTSSFSNYMVPYSQMWHKSCFNCALCHRPLDSMLACDGPDREIYCKSCYGRKYGPKGFGYGHSPTLVSTNGESTILLWVNQNVSYENNEKYFP